MQFSTPEVLIRALRENSYASHLEPGIHWRPSGIASMRVIWTTSTVSRCSKRTMSTSSPNVGASAVTVMPRTSLSQVIYVSPSNRHRLPRLWYAHLGNHLRGQHRPDAGYQALIDQYTGNLERDQAQFINAQANLTRYSQLGDKGWATPQLIETQKAQVGQLQAAIKADQ